MEQRQFFVRDVLTVIFKYKALIVTLPILVFVLVFVGNYVWPPTYESSAKVRITRGREVSQTDTTVTRATQELTMVQMGVEDIRSEIELIHSRDLLERVVTELNLDKDSAFPYGSGLLHKPFRAMSLAIEQGLQKMGLRGKSDAIRKAMDELDKRIITTPIRDTYVMEISCRMGGAEESQRILQKVLDVYQKLHIELFANEKSSPFFQTQKERVEKELAAAQAALQEFNKSANLSLIDKEKEMLLQQYTDGTKVLTQLSQTETALAGDGVNTSVIQSLSRETASTVVREMQLRLLELVLELNRVSQSLGPKHPTVQSLTEQVGTAQKNLVEAINNTRKSTEAELTTIQARLDQLNETRAKLDNLQQEVEILKKNYEYYAEKLEQSRVADELAKASISNVKIASSPTLPIDPIRPNKLLNLVLALVGGLIAALALAFLRDYFDHGVKTPEDVDYYFKITPLASFFNKPGQPLNAAEAEQCSVLLEAGASGAAGRCLEVTSAVPREGAGPFAKALAEAYANDPNCPTLLIDFAGDIVPGRNTRGMSDVLLGEAGLESIFTSSQSLTIVGRGSHADTPSYLWGTERMQDIMKALRSRYHCIIFNSGAVLQSHDALKLAPYADGIVIAIKANATRREVVMRALGMFMENKSKVVGAVLTERTQTIPQAVYRRI